jgi:hypothetical protein
MRIANGVELAKYKASVTGESSGRGTKMANSARTGAAVRVGAIDWTLPFFVAIHDCTITFRSLNVLCVSQAIRKTLKGLAY